MSCLVHGAFELRRGWPDSSVDFRIVAMVRGQGASNVPRVHHHRLHCGRHAGGLKRGEISTAGRADGGDYNRGGGQQWAYPPGEFWILDFGSNTSLYW
jgi:hypothetical protein